MDNNEFKLNETGINPVNTASENNDVYFTNVKTQKADINRRENITHTAQNNGNDIPKKLVPVKKGNLDVCLFYCCYCAFHANFSLCDFLYE